MSNPQQRAFHIVRSVTSRTIQPDPAALAVCRWPRICTPRTSVPVPQMYCEACGTALTADIAHSRYCLDCNLLVCPACWKATASRCRACAAQATAGPNRARRGAAVRTARRADRRLREARTQATLLADNRPDASVARVDHAALAVKAATAERVGMSALRRLTAASAVRAQPLADRMRRHADEADAAIKRAEATLAIEIGAAPVAISAVQERTATAATLRELHGGQLHGFALLLTLGDQPAAATLAADALAAGSVHADELQHPGRATTWLRHSVLAAAARAHRTDPNYDEPTRRVALRALGVNDEAHAALSALGILERAAVVASAVEGLEEPDVATVVGLDPERSRRLVRDALRRAISAGMAEPSKSGPDGPIVARTREIAARVLA